MVTVSNVGIAAIAQLIIGGFTTIATGSSIASESTSATALESENTSYGFQRTSATCSFVSPGTAKWTHRFTASGGTVTLGEIGIFNETTMLLRSKLTEQISYDDTEYVDITVTLSIGRV